MKDSRFNKILFVILIKELNETVVRNYTKLILCYFVELVRGPSECDHLVILHRGGHVQVVTGGGAGERQADT